MDVVTLCKSSFKNALTGEQGLIPNTKEDPELLSYMLFGTFEFVA